VCFAVSAFVMAFLFAATFDERDGTAARVEWGFVYGLAFTSCVYAGVFGLGHLLNRRAYRRLFRAGKVLEVGFGEQTLLLRGALQETTLSFHALISVKRTGDWVTIKHVGVTIPQVSLWPAELFPPEDLGRLRRAIETRKLLASGAAVRTEISDN
jgi:hypothetical protein